MGTTAAAMAVASVVMVEMVETGTSAEVKAGEAVEA